VVADEGLRKKFRTMSRADCAVLASVTHARLRLVQVEHQLVEQAELETRLRDVEDTLRSRWGSHAV
jgi:hypothetical protein